MNVSFVTDLWHFNCPPTLFSWQCWPLRLIGQKQQHRRRRKTMTRTRSSKNIITAITRPSMAPAVKHIMDLGAITTKEGKILHVICSGMARLDVALTFNWCHLGWLWEEERKSYCSTVTTQHLNDNENTLHLSLSHSFCLDTHQMQQICHACALIKLYACTLEGSL